MDTVSVESLARDALDRGLDGESAYLSVRSRIGQLERNGARIDWRAFKPTNPFWREGLTKNSSGRRASKQEIQSALNRYAIDWVIKKVRQELDQISNLPRVFAFTEEAADQSPAGTSQNEDEDSHGRYGRSLRNVTTKDPVGILFATSPQRIREHDRDDLFRQLIPLLWKISGEVATRFDLPWVDRDDLVQEARAQVWTKFPTFRGDGWLKSWVARVARNAMIDFAVGQAKLPTASIEDEERATVAEAAAVDIELKLDLFQSLRESEDAALLLLNALYGYSESELAEAAGYEAGSRAVSMRISRSRKAVREALLIAA